MGAQCFTKKTCLPPLGETKKAQKPAQAALGRVRGRPWRVWGGFREGVTKKGPKSHEMHQAFGTPFGGSFRSWALPGKKNSLFEGSCLGTLFGVVFWRCKGCPGALSGGVSCTRTSRDTFLSFSVLAPILELLLGAFWRPRAPLYAPRGAQAGKKGGLKTGSSFW